MFHMWVQSNFATEASIDFVVMVFINLKFPKGTSLSNIVDESSGGLGCEVNDRCCFTSHSDYFNIEPDNTKILGWDLKWEEVPENFTILTFDAWTFETVKS